MKYIKLFEAFSSQKLSKTLGYLNKSNKDKFIDVLKNVCDVFKIPMSRITDDCFLYLPYKKAISYNKKSDSTNIKLIKFWFSVDGEYIDASYSDSTKEESNFAFSRDLNDYDLIRKISIDDLSNLPIGSPVYLKCDSDGMIKKGVGILYKYKSRFFILQDFADGARPELFGDSSKNIKYSWHISSIDDYDEMTLLDKNKETENDQMLSNYRLFFKKTDRYGRVINPLSLEYNTSKNIYGLHSHKYPMTNDLLTNANFSLILDLDLIESKSYNLDKIKSDRVQSKKDAFISNDEFKSKNIDRYIKGILNLPVTSDISPVLIKRALGYDKIIFVMSVIDYKKRLDKLIEKYDKVLNADSKASTRKAIDDVKRYLKKLMGESLIANKNYTKFSSDIKDALKKEDNTKSLQIIDGIEKLSSLIYQKLKINNIETIYDLEILLGKISNIESMLKSKRNGLDLIYKGYIQNSLNTNFNTRYRLISENRFLPDIETFRKGLDRVNSIISNW